MIVAQGVLTLSALFAGRQPAVRYAAQAGGFAIAVIGAWSVYRTLSGPHFEGYAVVLGSALVLQGALTFLVFLRATAFCTSV